MTKGGIVLNGTATGFSKAAVIIGGQAVKFYKGAVIVGGQAVRIFKAAVEWIYAIALSGTISTVDSYGNSDSSSANIQNHNSSEDESKTATCTVDYTFSEPLSLSAGSVLSSAMTVQPHSATFIIYLDGVQAASYTKSGNVYTGTETFTLAEDKTISKISVSVTVTSPKASSGSTWDMGSIALTISPTDGDSFLLNNSGSSD